MTFSIDKIPIQYLIKPNGKKTAVQIPIEDWKAFKKRYLGMAEYFFIQNEIRKGLLEIEEIKKGNASFITLEEFLKSLDEEE